MLTAPGAVRNASFVLPVAIDFLRQAEKRKGQAVRRQPFHGGPVITVALKYYRRADLAKSRERKLRAGDGFFEGLNLEVWCCQIPCG
jgi:hypothetical protein